MVCMHHFMENSTAIGILLTGANTRLLESWDNLPLCPCDILANALGYTGNVYYYHEYVYY